MTKKKATRAKPAAARSNKLTVIKILLVVLIIAIVAIGIGVGSFIYKRTNGFAEDFKKMHVVINGQQYVNDATIRLPMAGTQRIDVGYLGKIEKGFTYSIYANDEATFEYTVDGLPYQFTGEFTDCFNIVKSESSLTIKTNAETPVSIMKHRYGDDCKIIAPTPEPDKVYYNLYITSTDSGQIITVGLKFEDAKLTLPGNINF